ncbi:MAG TPA: efflux RND transporter periplasmic adaptor subunit [Pyrinomonadaceae bacterium]|nr:efflux RND transporter periplasmic adaptor subunit [Pyrinomonadaceae bacterium]
MTLPRPLKLTLLVLLLASVVTSLTACNRSNGQGNSASASASPTPAAIQISTTSAVMRQLPRFFEANGNLAPNQQADVAAETSGKVAAVGVDLGSSVRRGQMIVKLDDADFRIRVQQAQAQLDQAKATQRQNEAKIGLRPGQKFNPENVPEVAGARSALELAEKNLRRYEKLVETGDISRSAYDQMKSQRDQLAEQYQALIHQAQQNYAAVANAQAAVDAAATQLALAKRNLGYTVVVSPMPGYVSERPADVGEYVSPQQKVATVVNMNPLRVRIDIPEQAISQIHTGENVSVSVAAYPDRNFAGHVARVSPNVTTASRTLTVEADVENPKAELKPGQFATVRILLPQTEPAVLVPQRALRTISGATYVFVIKNGHAEQRLVQSGQTEGDLVELKSGVAADEVVATSNVDQLSDGAAVRQ